MTIGQNALLLAGYSLGLGIPFLLFAVALDRASGLLRSPCVLPLVPAYVFYLSGRTFSKTTAD